MSFSGWKSYKLDDLVDSKRGISYGIVQPGEFVKEGGVPILKVNNLTERKTGLDDIYRVSKEVESKFSRTRLQGNEILISVVGSLGHLHKVTDKEVGWNVVRAIAVLPLRSDVNRDWVYWCLKSPILQAAFQNRATVTVQATLNIKELKEIEIPFPDSKTQNQIASILSSLDDKIELNRQTNQTLEAMAQALFTEMCLPKGEGLPAGWRIGKLGDFYKTTSGGTPSRSKMEFYENGTINWVKSKELGASFVLDTEEKITEAALKQSSAKLLPVNSVMLAMYGATVGEISILGMPASSNQAICSILPNVNYSFLFVYEFLKSQKENLKNMAVGGAQQNISQTVIQGLEITMPSATALKDFYSVVSPIYDSVKCRLEEIQTLTYLRDGLLSKLMKGEIELNHLK